MRYGPTAISHDKDSDLGAPELTAPKRQIYFVFESDVVGVNDAVLKINMDDEAQVAYADAVKIGEQERFRMVTRTVGTDDYGRDILEIASVRIAGRPVRALPRSEREEYLRTQRASEAPKIFQSFFAVARPRPRERRPRVIRRVARTSGSRGDPPHPGDDDPSPPELIHSGPPPCGRLSVLIGAVQAARTAETDK
jgi:hypothetical protein